MTVPKKIIVAGTQGAGKTTTAVKIGKKLDLPVHFVDRIVFDSSWKERPVKDKLKDYIDISKDEKWIFDSYNSIFPKELTGDAEVIIYIKSSRIRSYINIIKRRIGCIFKKRIGVPENSNNKIYFSLLKKVWGKNKEYERQLLQHMKDVAAKAEIIIVKSITKKKAEDLVRYLKNK